MRTADIIRYGLWGAVAMTAAANHRHYNMTTTWLPHLLTNTASLLLPDLYRVLFRKTSARRDPIGAMVRDNPAYALYVAPLALGYILSHPDFNIYKGELAEIRLTGFGLDAIPHSATACALCLLASDTAERAQDVDLPPGALNDLLVWGRAHPNAFSALVLASATVVWEAGEYWTHQHEMNLRGDAALINMQWSVRDTANDIAANAFGWLASAAFRYVRREAARKPGSTLRAASEGG